MSGLYSPLSLKRNFSWTLVGNGIYAAGKWINVLILAKLAAPDVVGDYALGLAIAAPVMMLTDLHLRAIQATDARRDHRFSDYLRLRGAGILVGLGLICAIAFSFYDDESVLLAILGVATFKAIESLADIFYGLFQKRERMDLIARSMLVKATLGTAAFALVYHAGSGLLTAILSLAAIHLVVFIFHDVVYAGALARSETTAAPTGPPLRVATRLVRLASVAWPMGLVMMLGSLQVNIPRYAIEIHEGAAALGIFSALAYLVALGALFVGSLGQTISPRLARYFAAGDLAAFRRLVLRMLGIVLGLGLAGIAVSVLFGESLLRRLYNADYAMENELFVLLMVVSALSFCGGVFGTAVTAMRLFRAQAMIQAANVILITALAFPLVRTQGLQGAAWAMLISAALVATLYALLTWRSIRAAA